MPSHTHSVNLNTNSNGAHSHSYVDTLFPYQNYGQAGGHIYPNENYFHEAANINKPSKFYNRNWNTESAGAHSHSVTGETTFTGSNVPIDNRPPYYVVVYIIFKGL